jgi:hypothetical protein
MSGRDGVPIKRADQWIDDEAYKTFFAILRIYTMKELIALMRKAGVPIKSGLPNFIERLIRFRISTN